MNMAQSEAQRWARNMLDLPIGDALILDTETCGLNAEVIELAIIDTAGNQIFNRRFNPRTPIHPGAFAVHGISREMLADEVSFADEHEVIAAILAAAKMVLIYNAAFDTRCLAETCRLHLQPPFVFKSACLMQWYAIWVGEKRRGTYKWQSLTGGDHSAVGDCRAALAFLRRMAGGPLGAEQAA